MSDNESQEHVREKGTTMNGLQVSGTNGQSVVRRELSETTRNSQLIKLMEFVRIHYSVGGEIHTGLSKVPKIPDIPAPNISALLSPLSRMGLFRNLDKGVYEVTEDALTMPLIDVYDLYRQFLNERKGMRGKRKPVDSTPTVEQQPDEEEESVEVDTFEMAKQLGVEGLVSLLVELIEDKVRADFGAIVDRTEELEDLKAQSVLRNHEIEAMKQTEVSLREQLKEARRLLLERQQRVDGVTVTKAPEKVYAPAVEVQPGNRQASGITGGMSFAKHRRMSVGKRPRIGGAPKVVVEHVTRSKK